MKTLSLYKGGEALVDDDVWEWAKDFRWFKGPKNSYPSRYISEEKRQVALHREIMKAPKGAYVDHIDGNTMNCQRSNLRLCSNAENLRNRPKPRSRSKSPYKGVCFYKRDRVWVAQITKDRKFIYLGRFHDEVEAAMAYNEAALRLFGEFAYLNKFSSDWPKGA